VANYWLFVSVPYTDFNAGQIKDIIGRDQSALWEIGKKTVNKQQFSPGDQIIFYQGGKSGQTLIGTAEIASKLRRSQNPINDYVKIHKISLFKHPVPIKPVLNKLSFVRNIQYWGLYFKGGIIKLTKNDYLTFLTYARVLN